MTDNNEVKHIADASIPNAGRIYDYLLGGNHNFEIDRQAASQIVKLSPHMPDFFRLIRWFLGEATRRLCDEGFDKFIDFASGLPTVDHIHKVSPAGTKVVYSDLDPVTVAYAQEIIQDAPNVKYFQCHAGKPEELLNSGHIEEVFGSNRKNAIGLNGIAWFLTDEELAHSLSVLFEWAAEGSKLFLCDFNTDVENMSDAAKETVAIYRNMGQHLHLRNRKTLLDCLGSWKIVDPGFQSVEDWLGIDNSVSQKIIEAWDIGELAGVFLTK